MHLHTEAFQTIASFLTHDEVRVRVHHAQGCEIETTESL